MQDPAPGDAFDPLDDLAARAEEEEYEEEEYEEDAGDEAYEDDDDADDDEDVERAPAPRAPRAARLAGKPAAGSRRRGGGDEVGDRLRDRGRARGRKGRKRFDIGNAIAKTFSVWFKNIVPFTLLSVVIFSPMLIWAVAAVASHDVNAITTFSQVAQILAFVLSNTLVAMLIYGVFQRLRGNRAPLSKCFQVGLSRLASVLVVAVLVVVLAAAPLIPGIALAVGGAVGGGVAAAGVGVLLILAGVIPMVIISLGLTAAVPSCVVERTGILESLGRSWSLTKRLKGEIFVVSLVVNICIFAITCLTTIPFAMIAVQQQDPTMQVLVQQAMAVLMAPLQATMTGVIYHDLRVQKEGVASEELAAIFD